MNKIAYGMSVFILSGALLLTSCSTNLGPETLPSTSATTEPTETEPEVTVTTLPPEATDPASTPVVIEKAVELNGRLKVKGANIVNSQGKTFVLKGLSSYGIQDCSDFFTAEVIKTLAEDWGCNVIRISITGDAQTGYLKDPDKYFDPLCKICDMCINQGIYVILDWNVEYEKAANENKTSAVDFFSRISSIYSDSPNILYEIENNKIQTEDSAKIKDEWTKNIKPFAEEVIKAIRKNSPSSIVIVGAPDRGLGIDTISKTKIKGDNIAYACRIYSSTHGVEYREKVQKAIKQGICVFVTEWGLCSDNGEEGLNMGESDSWSQLFEENNISWCNYAIGSNFIDEANALYLLHEKYTNEQKAAHWPDGIITKSGLYVRKMLLKEYETVDETDSTDATESSETTATT